MEQEKAILVACQFPGETEDDCRASLEELEALAKTAGALVVQAVMQKREMPEPATYIGKGKLDELKAIIAETSAELVIFNDELSPSQTRNLSDVLETKIIDRTRLILDIFARRAKSREGQLQVELAQLEYLLPRLSGIGKELSRLGGGIGTRGPGETKLETDRRHLLKRIHDIKNQLKKIVEHRERYRKKRKKRVQFQAALIGYTNAGKSTLFNRLTRGESFVQDRLFATLDPLARRLVLPCGYQILLSDTVGFIDRLPTSLVASFRSTLEEALSADLLIHVVDSSHPDYERHEKTVQRILRELQADDLPVLTVYNKRDRQHPAFFPLTAENFLSISAFNEQDLQRLKKKIESMILLNMNRYQVLVPEGEGTFLSRLKRETILLSAKYDGEKKAYRCTGGILPEHPLNGLIRKYSKGEETDE